MKNLNEKIGTVAYTVSRRMNEIDYSSLGAAKASLIEILKSPEITERKAADTFIIHVSNMTNMSKLLSTIGTYASGLKC